VSEITVAYSGVHQVFQLALAAHEMGKLDRLCCSFIEAPGKWGGLLSRFFGSARLSKWRHPEIPSAKVFENPWPKCRYELFSRILTRADCQLEKTNGQFDFAVARRLRASSSRLFVGVETCALHSFEAAKSIGMKLVLDCHGIHAQFRDRVAREAALEWELPTPTAGDSPTLAARKEREIELADRCLVYSEGHKRSFVENGVPESKLVCIPLWVDSSFWYPTLGAERGEASSTLKVLYAGHVTLRKGIPYLLRAMEACAKHAHLTLAGNVSRELAPVVRRYAGCFSVLPRQTRSELRKLFWDHDVLVMPSLGDSFGFVALEAMACGLPVIVTENCGVPVPDEAWRVPVMESEAIAQRLLMYSGDRDICRAHGREAAGFAQQFTPERYRREVQQLFRTMLSESERMSQKAAESLQA
jgi:glycosyltransferase involved in cell wall biosynthesis